MNLWNYFTSSQAGVSTRWTQYFPIYERHFEKFRNRTLTFLEIGTYKGGGSLMWSRYFGPLSNIISIDINPDCKQYEQQNINVRIGDQSNLEFLQSVIDEFGIPDIVLDDGSHDQNHINASFDFLYPKMPYNSIYLIEDLHTSYWESHHGGLYNQNTFINRSKQMIDQLNINYTKGALEKDQILDGTFSINFYDSIVVLEKQKPYKNRSIWNGGFEADP